MRSGYGEVIDGLIHSACDVLAQSKRLVSNEIFLDPLPVIFDLIDAFLKI
jgi:hypothetical protein